MLSKILPANNFHILLWSYNFSNANEQKLTPFYDFENNGIKNRYFIIKDIEFQFFTPDEASGQKIVWEAAYDNAAATVNANTRYSITDSRPILFQDFLLCSSHLIKIKINANGTPIGIFDAQYYPITYLNYKNIFAFVPNKLQSDFDIRVSPAIFFKDILGNQFYPFVAMQMTGFSLDEDQLNNLKAIDLQKVQIVQPKEVKSSGILKNPQPPDKPEFFYE